MPTVRAMDELGTPFHGVLYAGLMITEEGPKLIEYNVRFGDPECQVLMMRLRSDLVELLLAVCNGQLKNVNASWLDETALSVVMAAKGYPGSYEKGSLINGLQDAGAAENVEIFHAGTLRDENGEVRANGGRVLNLTATGPTVGQAREAAYAAVEKIDWPDGFCRSDIGWRAIERETVHRR